MANQQDLVRLLTGISGTQQPVQPAPVAGSKDFAGMFGAQQAAKLSGGIQNLARGGAPSPQQNIASAISDIDLTSADGLRTMAKVKQVQGDPESANALNQQAAAMEEKEKTALALKEQVTKTRVSVIERLKTDPRNENVIPLVENGVFDGNFQDLLPLLQPSEKGVELSKPFSGTLPDGTPVMLSVKSEKGMDDVVVDALTKKKAASGTTITKDGSKVEVNLGQEGESAFLKELGKKKAASVIASYDSAQASSIKSNVLDTQWETISKGAGILTGTLAEVKLGAGKLLKSVGLLSGEGDELIANTETFIANAGNLVAEVIKAFGAGTGLSDADREFAKGIVGGSITLDGESLKRLLILQARATKKKIQEHNKAMGKLSGDTAQFGLIVDVPEFSWAAVPKDITKEEHLLLKIGDSYTLNGQTFIKGAK